MEHEVGVKTLGGDKPEVSTTFDAFSIVVSLRLRNILRACVVILERVHGERFL
jgi:hypothetical protein